MPKCKICGEDVRAGMVMHFECCENWEADLRAREETIRERERELDMREREQEIHEGFLDHYYDEILGTDRRARGIMIINLVIAAFNITTAVINIIL